MTETDPTTPARLHAIETRLNNLGAMVAAADNKDDLLALREQVLTLNQAVQLQIKALDDRMAEMSRQIARFNEQERYAITRALISRILAEEAATLSTSTASGYTLNTPFMGGIG